MENTTTVVSDMDVDNANDSLQEHICTDGYHRYLGGVLGTDGVMALAEKFSCFWLLDVVASYQHEMKRYSFQVWKMVKSGDKAVVTCTDGNNKVLRTQKIPYTDIAAKEATIWVEGNVMLLPSEH